MGRCPRSQVPGGKKGANIARRAETILKGLRDMSDKDVSHFIALRAKGLSNYAIASETGFSRKRIAEYVLSEKC